jgi:hypothetical protein
MLSWAWEAPVARVAAFQTSPARAWPAVRQAPLVLPQHSGLWAVRGVGALLVVLVVLAELHL